MHAAMIREHLRIPGMGTTTARLFRDKLAMRVKAFEAGIRVPDFVHVLNYDEIRGYMETVPAPWVLKPRSDVSAVGIQKLHDSELVWRAIDALDARPVVTERSTHYLLERFVPGDVFHVDSLVENGEVIFTGVNRYWRPPMEVAHKGGVFLTNTVRRGCERGTATARDEPGPAQDAGVRPRRHARGVHPQRRRRVLLPGGRRPGGRRLHLRFAGGRDGRERVARVGQSRNRARRSAVRPPAPASRLRRRRARPGATGVAGHQRLCRSGSRCCARPSVTMRRSWSPRPTTTACSTCSESMRAGSRRISWPCCRRWNARRRRDASNSVDLTYPP